jgi:hypothetical protein
MWNLNLHGPSSLPNHLLKKLKTDAFLTRASFLERKKRRKGNSSKLDDEIPPTQTESNTYNNIAISTLKRKNSDSRRQKS